MLAYGVLFMFWFFTKCCVAIPSPPKEPSNSFQNKGNVRPGNTLLDTLKSKLSRSYMDYSSDNNVHRKDEQPISDEYSGKDGRKYYEDVVTPEEEPGTLFNMRADSTNPTAPALPTFPDVVSDVAEAFLEVTSTRSPHTPDAHELDMAPAKGSLIGGLRLNNKLCDRSILWPEGPKYNHKGQPYLPAYKKINNKGFVNTKKPKYVLPRCCNCCKKSVLGCY